jgi:hypothetical protein
MLRPVVKYYFLNKLLNHSMTSYFIESPIRVFNPPPNGIISLNAAPANLSTINADTLVPFYNLALTTDPSSFVTITSTAPSVINITTTPYHWAYSLNICAASTGLLADPADILSLVNIGVVGTDLSGNITTDYISLPLGPVTTTTGTAYRESSVSICSNTKVKNNIQLYVLASSAVHTNNPITIRATINLLYVP